MSENRLSRLLLLIIIPISLMSLACTRVDPPLGGMYRGVLDSPGGELAFLFELTADSTGWTGAVHNGADRARFSHVVFDGDSLELGFAHYDSYLRAVVSAEGHLEGYWVRRGAGTTVNRMAFRAERGATRRYTPADAGTAFAGTWAVRFTDAAGSTPAEAVFAKAGDRWFGTFRTETGDYRFLEGTASADSLVLSVFDGAHAFLFKGHLEAENRIFGRYWSRDAYTAQWDAEPGAATLRDPFSITKPSAPGVRAAFELPDQTGAMLSLNDPRFAGKPVVLYLFGTWCPNCADVSTLLKELHAQYADRGLEVVGLAFEYSGDFATDADMVRRYRERFEVPWPTAIAGISDKAAAGKVVSFLDAVVAYPTTVFLNRDHTIRAVHTGFNGPGTGSYYFQEIERFKSQLDAITR